MSPDGTKVLDEGKVIVDDHSKLPTLEGPKFYKQDGYYYIFAPYGGVGTGSQAVLRSKNIYGPYESRPVLEQGSTSVNGPHQGGYVETANGEGWFLHFSQRGGYGRILYLEPVQWKNGWPVVGKPVEGKSFGEPVSTWKKPDSGSRYPIETPQTSDEFNDAAALGPQWEWNHNPNDNNWSLKERPGFLRLKASFASDLIHARNTLTQQMQYQDFDLTTRIDVSAMKDGQRAGLTMFGVHPSWIGIVQTNGAKHLVYANNGGESEFGKLTEDTVLVDTRFYPQDRQIPSRLVGGRHLVPRFSRLLLNLGHPWVQSILIGFDAIRLPTIFHTSRSEYASPNAVFITGPGNDQSVCQTPVARPRPFVLLPASMRR
jgi:beta-xylosidase